jgi:hypothetical protein
MTRDEIRLEAITDHLQARNIPLLVAFCDVPLGRTPVLNSTMYGSNALQPLQSLSMLKQALQKGCLPELGVCLCPVLTNFRVLP